MKYVLGICAALYLLALSDLNPLLLWKPYQQTVSLFLNTWPRMAFALTLGALFTFFTVGVIVSNEAPSPTTQSQ